MSDSSVKLAKPGARTVSRRLKATVDACGTCITVIAFLTPLYSVALALLLIASAYAVLDVTGTLKALSPRFEPLQVHFRWITGAISLLAIVSLINGHFHPEVRHQSLTSMGTEALGEMRKTNDNLENIEKEIRKLKKETSNNPRKELANLGIPLEFSSFSQAIESNDEDVVRLFFAIGQSVTASHFRDIVGLDGLYCCLSSTMIDLLASRTKVTVDDCVPDEEMAAQISGNSSKRDYFATVCNSPEVRSAIERQIASFEAENAATQLKIDNLKGCENSHTRPECRVNNHDHGTPEQYRMIKRLLGQRFRDVKSLKAVMVELRRSPSESSVLNDSIPRGGISEPRSQIEEMTEAFF